MFLDKKGYQSINQDEYEYDAETSMMFYFPGGNVNENEAQVEGSGEGWTRLSLLLFTYTYIYTRPSGLRDQAEEEERVTKNDASGANGYSIPMDGSPSPMTKKK